MEKMLYKNKNDWNEEEKKTGYASYKTFTDQFFDNMILCNNIVNADELEIVCGSDYNEDMDQYVDIFQYYIVDVYSWSLDELKEKYQDEVILYYSNLLDVYVLGVPHLGTSWSYVSTNIRLTSDINEIIK